MQQSSSLEKWLTIPMPVHHFTVFQHVNISLNETENKTKQAHVRFWCQDMKQLKLMVNTENGTGTYFGMEGSALSPSRGQKHTTSE